jgi:hypothetical protein
MTKRNGASWGWAPVLSSRLLDILVPRAYLITKRVRETQKFFNRVFIFVHAYLRVPGYA